jgi:hypothetical protein
MDGEGGMLNCFMCPITHELMSDPVIAGDGHTYERAAIVNWLQRNDRSPVTNERLSSRALIPNFTIKQAVHEYCEKCGTKVSPPFSNKKLLLLLMLCERGICGSDR